MWKVQLFKLNYDEREVKAVSDTVRSGWITMGEKVQEFERAFGTFLGAGCLLHGRFELHGSAAHVAARAWRGARRRGGYPCTDFCLRHQRGEDCGRHTRPRRFHLIFRLEHRPERCEEEIDRQNQGVMIVHFAGYPCDMEAILAVIDEANRSVKKEGRLP